MIFIIAKARLWLFENADSQSQQATSKLNDSSQLSEIRIRQKANRERALLRAEIRFDERRIEHPVGECHEVWLVASASYPQELTKKHKNLVDKVL